MGFQPRWAQDTAGLRLGRVEACPGARPWPCLHLGWEHTSPHLPPTGGAGAVAPPGLPLPAILSPPDWECPLIREPLISKRRETEAAEALVCHSAGLGKPAGRGALRWGPRPSPRQTGGLTSVEASLGLPFSSLETDSFTSPTPLPTRLPGRMKLDNRREAFVEVESLVQLQGESLRLWVP